MKTIKVKLSQVKVNAANPRTIREHKLNLLIERLLVFPKMIELRPIVIDNKMIALGGNMRINALNRIASMTFEQVASIIGKTKNYQRLTKGEQELLLVYWQNWLNNPDVTIAKASDFSEEEKKEFVIADNASFGEWDYDKLANEWNNDDLNSWGVDVWQPESSSQVYTSSGNSTILSEHERDEQQTQIDSENLPQELQGLDMTPDKLPKIEGDNETVMERIIIVYPKEREADIAKLIGLPSIDKIVYHISELKDLS